MSTSSKHSRKKSNPQPSPASQRDNLTRKLHQLKDLIHTNEAKCEEFSTHISQLESNVSNLRRQIREKKLRLFMMERYAEECKKWVTVLNEFRERMEATRSEYTKLDEGPNLIGKDRALETTLMIKIREVCEKLLQIARECSHGADSANEKQIQSILNSIEDIVKSTTPYALLSSLAAIIRTATKDLQKKTKVNHSSNPNESRPSSRPPDARKSANMHRRMSSQVEKELDRKKEKVELVLNQLQDDHIFNFVKIEDIHGQNAVLRAQLADLWCRFDSLISSDPSRDMIKSYTADKIEASAQQTASHFAATIVKEWRKRRDELSAEGTELRDLRARVEHSQALEVAYNINTFIGVLA
ncbi:uncharacterized protein VTP21DRAFT_11315 [Calcarisporiella thermophila]|uniref:uncharacterized protein n=1 Tax=Calcarisporiella thermophila TaxID=911321 RepID=UPI0037426B35